MNYQALKRRLRAHPLLWSEGPKSEQIGRIIDRCKEREADQERQASKGKPADQYANLPGYLSRADFA